MKTKTEPRIAANDSSQHRIANRRRTLLTGVLVAGMVQGVQAYSGNTDFIVKPTVAIEGVSKGLFFKRDFMNELGNSKSGRVLLHTLCLIRHPERARWHWRGIVREFAPSS